MACGEERMNHQHHQLNKTAIMQVLIFKTNLRYQKDKDVIRFHITQQPGIIKMEFSSEGRR